MKILNKTKKGITSLLVTAVVILIFGVITVSFTRLVISEVTQTSNNDLSQSAYDAALAGIEDAKSALMQYHNCIDGGATASYDNGMNGCSHIITEMQAGITAQDCDTVAKTLKRKVENGGVVIQETQTSETAGNSANMVQAYTCVTVEEELRDYRTTLDANNTMRIVPIRTTGTGGTGGVDRINNVDAIELSWFSAENIEKISADGSYPKYCADFPTLYGCDGGLMAPPTIGVHLMQADTEFSLGELSVANIETSGSFGGAAHNTNRAAAYLHPVNVASTKPTEISGEAFASTGSDSMTNAFSVNCSNDNLASRGFYCTARIGIPKPFRGGTRNEGAFFLLVSLPYTQPETDISLQVFNSVESGDFSAPYALYGVQARVDSTGRANDMYRRIETRVELVDTYFPYPMYEIQMSDGADVIDKSFRTTFNCWTSDDGAVSTCENFFRDSSLSNWK